MRSCTLFLTLALAPLGCTNENDDTSTSTGTSTGTSGDLTGGNSCVPGEIAACLCPDDTPSTQICLADGSDYSACDCIGTMTGGGTGTGGDTSSGGGTGDSTGSTTSDDGSTDGTSVTDDGGTSTGGPPPECDGSHPLVEGDLRYCEQGFCYCGDFMVDPPFDVCYAAEIAEPCCPVDVVCY